MLHKEKEILFKEVVKNHKDQVYRICWGFSKEMADVEDLFQEVMLKVWKGLDGFKGRSQISTWLYRITVNCCLLWKKRKQKASTLIDAQQINLEINAVSEEERMIHNERIKRLREVIQQLNSIDKSIMLLLLEELSYEEIASVTGLSVNHVGVKINRIKKQLKKLLV